MAADTEIIAGYEVYTPEAAAELPTERVQHPLGESITYSIICSWQRLTFVHSDQLTVAEIIEVADIVQKHYKDARLKFNVITLKVSNTNATFQVAKILNVPSGSHQI